MSNNVHSNTAPNGPKLEVAQLLITITISKLIVVYAYNGCTTAQASVSSFMCHVGCSSEEWGIHKE